MKYVRVKIQKSEIKNSNFEKYFPNFRFPQNINGNILEISIYYEQQSAYEPLEIIKLSVIS